MNIRAIRSNIQSILAGSGYFDTVNMHESKSAPGNGVTAEVWGQSISPVSQRSGLNKTSLRVVFSIRIMTPMLSEPQDMIESILIEATVGAMALFVGDIDLGDESTEIDVRGAYGESLMARAGYLTQDQKTFRVYTLTLPIIINDDLSEVRQ